jgi:hypothetical protein
MGPGRSEGVGSESTGGRTSREGTEDVMPKGIAVSKESGRKFELVRPKETGLVPCIGEAHHPDVHGMIDHCMLCAPRWGQMMSYEKLGPEKLGEGQAIKCVDAESEFLEGDDFYVEQLTEKTRAYTATFFAWVRK